VPDTSPPPSGSPRADTRYFGGGAVVAVAPRRQDSIYNGALAEPIMLRPPPTFWGAAVPKRIAAYQKKLSRHQRASAAVVQRQRSRKLALLFDHYGIADKEDMAKLALALAVAHIPGFKVQFPEAKSKKGRKRKWHPDRLEELHRTVQSIKQQHRFTDRHALTFIVNNQRHAATWGVPKEHKGPKQQWTETLESRLQEAKSFQKLYDQAERELQAIAASMKFRK
jgi:hypothetical protein